MKVDNLFTREYLLRYPIEAARVLEQVSAEHVAALFEHLSVQTGAPVLSVMMPDKAAACLEYMPVSVAAKIVTQLPASAAARIYRRVASAKRDAISAILSEKTQKPIRRNLEYPILSAGALLDSNVDILPDTINVTEALHRIERLGRSVSNEIYIIDNEHHLLGMMDIGKLITANRHVKLREIMSRKTQAISAHVAAESLFSHPGWKTRRRLPVVERDNTLVGVLDHNHLLNSLAESEVVELPSQLDGLLSLGSLYWLSVGRLMDSMLGGAVPNAASQSVSPPDSSQSAKGEPS